MEERGSLSSSSCVAAEEGVEHGLFEALLVLPAPGSHGPVAAGGVQMVAVTGEREAVRKKSRLYVTS